MKIGHAVCGILLSAIGILRADDLNEIYPDKATYVSFDLAAWCDVKGHRFTLEKTTLAEVIKVLGEGSIERTGTIGSANFDYYIDFTDGTHLIRFSSNNDMGGDDHELEGVEIMTIPADKKAKKLPRLPLPIRFPFGSSNCSLVAVHRKLGLAKEQDGSLAYVFTAENKGKDWMGKIIDYEINSMLQIRVQQGKIIALNVSRVISS